jgi:membrane protease YdiL (CAAX protease family)
MDDTPKVRALSASNGAEAHWQLLGTILWGIALAFAFVVVQTVATITLAIRGQGDLSEEQFESLLLAAQSNGTIFSVATLASALLCIPLIGIVAKLKKGSRLAVYLALRVVPLRTFARWLGLLIAYVVLTDALTLALGRPIVPEFMASSYASAKPAWLLWLAFVLFAPAFEETFFRGFLFKGLAQSLLGVYGAIALTALLWAALHLQYDAFGMTIIFFLGILLGLARATTGSLLVPLGMHAFANVVASAEAMFLT